MKLYVNTDVQVTLTLQEAMEHLRVQEDFEEEFEEIFEKCMEIAKPKYCFAEIEAAGEGDLTRIGDCTFDSRILRINMRGLNRAFPSIATCGRELYELSKACDDVLEQFWVDGISEMLMGKAGEVMRNEIRGITGQNIRAISPGSLGDFPIIEQPKLFRLLGDPMESVGVELTPQFLMLPYKSGSAFYFESDEEYENCMLCLREGCPNRRAEFNEKVFIEKYGLTEDDVRQKPGR